MAIRTFYNHGDGSSEWLVDWARRIYCADYEYSRADGDLYSSNERYPPTMLLEFYYKQPGAEALFAESEERLSMTLENFLTSATYAVVRDRGRCPGAKVEKPIFVRTTTFNARGKVDIAYPQDGKLTIVDWKTGEAEAPVESLQLVFYALWAVETEGYQLEDVALYRGELVDGSLQPIRLNGHILQRARARIVQDLERMRVLDGYGRDAVAGAFPPCSLPRVCKLCPYQGICPGVAR